MSGIFGMLFSATRALDAQRYGLDVAGQNIANVNTPGYTKRIAQFAEIPPTDRLRAGGGVDILGLASARDRLLDRRYWSELPQQQRQATLADQLGIAEVALGAPGQSIDKALNDFFDAWHTLQSSPTSSSARQEVVLQGQTLSRAFNDVASRLDTALSDADTRVRATVGEINTLSAQIAALNKSLGGTDPQSGEAQHLRDEITRNIDELSKLVDVNVVETSDGLYDVTFGSGRPLVVATNSYAIGITNRAVTGVADLTVNGVVVTNEVTAGKLGGLIAARDVNIPSYQTAVDQLAFTVANQVNATHTSGYDINGNAGVNFFAAPAGVTAAAQNFAMNAALTAPNGGQLVAASGDPLSSGDNQNARSMAALRAAKVMSGGQATFAESWGQLVYQAGRDVSVAASDQKVRSEIVQQVANLRDSVSGVSLDEEAADMMRFQRAYEANARFFSTVDDLLATLMGMVS